MMYAIFAGAALDRILEIPAGDAIDDQLGAGEVARVWAEPAPPPLSANVEATWHGLTAGCPVLVIDPVSGATAAAGAADEAGALSLLVEDAGPWVLALGWARRWTVEVSP